MHSKSNQKYLLLILLFLLPSNLVSQENSARNAAYIEVFGLGGLYSINYERFITNDFTARIGYTSWMVNMLGPKSRRGPIFMGSYLVGQDNNRMEIGAGVEFASAKGGSIFAREELQAQDYTMFLATFGYRYQPSDGGFHFRAVFMPMIWLNNSTSSSLTFGTFGISFGVCF